MTDELDTLVEAIATMLGTISGIKVVHTELPSVLTDPPEAWVKMGGGTSEPYEFGEQGEQHSIEVWIWIGMTKYAENEATLRKLWHSILRATMADETFGGTCEGIYSPITYESGWQIVGGPEYRRLVITIPCALEVVPIG